MSPGIHFDVKPKYFYDHDASVSWAKYEIISKKKGFFQEFSVGECEKDFLLFLPLGNVVKVWIIPKKKCLISKSFFDVNVETIFYNRHPWAMY